MHRSALAALAALALLPACRGTQFWVDLTIDRGPADALLPLEVTVTELDAAGATLGSATLTLRAGDPFAPDADLSRLLVVPDPGTRAVVVTADARVAPAPPWAHAEVRVERAPRTVAATLTLARVSLCAGTGVEPLVVDDTSDSLDNGWPSSRADEGPTLSFREALTLAHLDGGATILFDPTVFPPDAPAVISVVSNALPMIDSDATCIDGIGAGVIVDGFSLAAVDQGLEVVSAGNTIANVTIRGFTLDGILLRNDDNVVAGCTLDANGQYGVNVGNGAAGTVVGPYNVLTGNSDGIVLDFAVSATVVAGNFIGVGADLEGPGNECSGLSVDDGSNVEIRDNFIGSNASDGIQLSPLASMVLVHHNFIGTSADFSVNAGNMLSGLYALGSADVVIGPGNVIGHNVADGVRLTDTMRVTVAGNFISLDGLEAINLEGLANGALAAPVITTVAPTGGTAPVEAVSLELFSDEGDEAGWIVASDVPVLGGTWTYDGPLVGCRAFLTAAVTDEAGNTSALSAAVPCP